MEDADRLGSLGQRKMIDFAEVFNFLVENSDFVEALFSVKNTNTLSHIMSTSHANLCDIITMPKCDTPNSFHYHEKELL